MKKYVKLLRHTVNLSFVMMRVQNIKCNFFETKIFLFYLFIVCKKFKTHKRIEVKKYMHANYSFHI